MGESLAGNTYAGSVIRRHAQQMGEALRENVESAKQETAHF